MKQGSQSGADVLPKYNWGLGMNDEMMDHDRGGFTTSTEMLTGGVSHEWYCFGGLEVGNPYDLDPMGEERTDATFNKSESGPYALGGMGSMASEGSAGKQEGGAVVSGQGGRTMQSAPQTYTKYSKRS